MKKKVFLFFYSLLILTSCKTQEIKQYPSKEIFKKYNSEEINLDKSSLTFNKITHKVESHQSKNKRIVLVFKGKTSVKKIMLFYYGNGFIKTKNILFIKNDSIFTERSKSSIKDIYSILKNHYTNNGKDFLLSSSYKQAIIDLQLTKEYQSSKKLKIILQKITKTFDKINEEVKDSLNLFLFVNPFREKFPIPPPPKLFKN